MIKRWWVGDKTEVKKSRGDGRRGEERREDMYSKGIEKEDSYNKTVQD